MIFLIGAYFDCLLASIDLKSELFDLEILLESALLEINRLDLSFFAKGLLWVFLECNKIEPELLISSWLILYYLKWQQEGSTYLESRSETDLRCMI